MLLLSPALSCPAIIGSFRLCFSLWGCFRLWPQPVILPPLFFSSCGAKKPKRNTSKNTYLWHPTVAQKKNCCSKTCFLDSNLKNSPLPPGLLAAGAAWLLASAAAGGRCSLLLLGSGLGWSLQLQWLLGPAAGGLPLLAKKTQKHNGIKIENPSIEEITNYTFKQMWSF